MKTYPNKSNCCNKILTIAIVIIITLITLELSIRALFYVRNNQHITSKYSNPPENDAFYDKQKYIKKYDSFALMKYSSFLGYHPLENHRGNGYVTNQYGFRDTSNFPQNKLKNEIRIFITGGSSAWGAGISQEDLYSTILESNLRKLYPNMRIRVINAGVGAYFSTHERILILNKIINLSPDIVIMYSGWNDSYMGYRGTNLLKEQWDFLNAGPVLAKYIKQFAEVDYTGRRVIDLPRYDNYGFKTLYVLDKIKYYLNPHKKDLGNIARLKVKPTIIKENIFNNILTINDASFRHNFKLIYYLQPTLYNTNKILSDYENYLKQHGKDNYAGFSEYNAKIYTTLRKELPVLSKEHDFIYIDSDAALSKVEKTVFFDHVHLGDRGNKLISDHLIRNILPIINSLLKKQKNQKKQTDDNT